MNLSNEDNAGDFQEVQRQFGRQAPFYARAESVYGAGESLEAMMRLAARSRYGWAVDVATGAGYTGVTLARFAERTPRTDRARR